MTRSEARKIGKEMLREGFMFVELVEDLDTGECRVKAVNRCWMDRTVRNAAEWFELKAREVKV